MYIHTYIYIHVDSRKYQYITVSIDDNLTKTKTKPKCIYVCMLRRDQKSDYLIRFETSLPCWVIAFYRFQSNSRIGMKEISINKTYDLPFRSIQDKHSDINHISMDRNQINEQRNAICVPLLSSWSVTNHMCPN